MENILFRYMVSKRGGGKHKKQEIRGLLIDPDMDKKSAHLDNLLFPVIYIYEVWILFLIFTGTKLYLNFLFLTIAILAIITIDRVKNYFGLQSPKNAANREAIIEEFISYLDQPKKETSVEVKEIIKKLDVSRQKILEDQNKKRVNEISLGLLYVCLILSVFLHILLLTVLSVYTSYAADFMPLYISLSILIIVLGCLIYSDRRGIKQNFINIERARDLLGEAFLKTTKEIKNCFHAFIIRKDPPNKKEIGELNKFLQKWYDLYRGVYFQQDESNQLFLTNYDFYFSNERLNEYFADFSKLKTSLLIFRLILFPELVKENVISGKNESGTESIEKDILLALGYIKNFKVDIRTKFSLEKQMREELTHKWEKWEKTLSFLNWPFTIIAAVLSIYLFIRSLLP